MTCNYGLRIRKGRAKVYKQSRNGAGSFIGKSFLLTALGAATLKSVDASLPMIAGANWRFKIANKFVTIQQQHICFVSGLLMCKPAHIAGRLTGQRTRPLKSVRASAALLNSYGSG